MDEVAAEALVSRATAYRYFPSIEALLIEAPLDADLPGTEGIFRGEIEDPVERVDRAESLMHAMSYRNEAQLRLVLAQSLGRAAARGKSEGTPVRQNRRTPLIEAALAPSRDRFDDATYTRLCAALALLFGTEAMIVFRDVVPLSKAKARAVKSWAIRTLVRRALEESQLEREGGASRERRTPSRRSRVGGGRDLPSPRKPR
jgi:AcrR family transcriptional regulator